MELEISSLMRAITSVVTLAEKLASTSEKVKRAEITEVIANLRDESSQVRIRAAEANERIAALMEENQHLRQEISKLASPPELVRRDNGLYYKGEDTQPYCPNCYEGERKVSLLTQVKEFRMVKCTRCPYIKEPVNL